MVDGFISPVDAQRLNSKINGFDRATALLDGRMDKLDTRVLKLEDNTGSTKDNQQQAGVDLALQAAQAKAHATMVDKLSSAQKHMEQTQTLIGALHQTDPHTTTAQSIGCVVVVVLPAWVTS